MNTRNWLGLSIGLLLAVAPACSTTLITSPTSTALDLESTFSSQLLPGGRATRAVTLAARGTLGVTLSATTPAGMVVGVGVGIPRGDGSGCLLTVNVETAAGAAPQLAVTADSGTYCVQVFDVGNLTTAPVPFTVALSHP